MLLQYYIRYWTTQVLQLKEVPDNVTCTEVLQKWNIPSPRSGKTTKAVRLKDLIFEDAEYVRYAENKRKCRLVTGRRQNYCATPPFPKKVHKKEIEQLYSSLMFYTQVLKLFYSEKLSESLTGIEPVTF